MAKKKKQSSVFSFEREEKDRAADTVKFAGEFARNPQYRGICRNAASDYASKNTSDPFAYGRAFVRMKYGHANPAEVVKGSID